MKCKCRLQASLQLIVIGDNFHNILCLLFCLYYNFGRCVEDVGGDEVKVIDSLEEALKDADVVVTVTMATEPVVCGRWLKPGTVVCSRYQITFIKDISLIDHCMVTLRKI